MLAAAVLAAAITFGSAVGTASADTPIVDFGSISFSVTNGPDNTIYDINAIINLPPGTLPSGMMTPPITAPAAAPQPVNDYPTLQGQHRVDVVIIGGGFTGVATAVRSEERRVGKECRSRWSPYH